MASFTGVLSERNPDISTVPVIGVNAAGEIVYWNGQAEDLFLWKNREVNGKRLEEIFPHHNLPEDRRGHVTPGPINLRLFDKEGTKIPVEVFRNKMILEGREIDSFRFRKIPEQPEEDLYREKELFEFVFDSLPGIFYIQDENGKYLRWNKHFEKASGYTNEEIISMNAMDFFEKGEKERVQEAVREVFQNGKAEIVADVITKDKRILPFYFKAKAIFYQGRNCLIGTGFDLSQQQRAQMEVKKSEEKYRSLFEQASDPIMVTDFSGNFLDVNESLCRLFGYTKSELMGMNVRCLIDAEELKVQPMNFVRLAAGEHVFSKRTMIHKDGHAINVEANVKKISETSVLAIARDMTQRLKVESALAESENRLRTIFEADPECIKLLDAGCNLISMNPAGLSMIEAESLDQVAGQNVIPLVDPVYREAFVKLNNEAFEGKSGKLEFSITGLKGKNRWLEMNMVPLHNKAGQVQCSLSLARDITDQRQAAEIIRLSEERYRALVENAIEALVVYDVEKGKFESVSESALDFFKMTKEELLQIGPAEISPEFQPDGHLSSVKAKENLDRAIRGEKFSFEWLHCDKYGNPIPCEVWLVRLPSENKILVRGSIFNIAERKKSEQALKLSEKKYKLLFNKNPLPMLMLSKPDLRFIDVNDAAIAQYGYSREEFRNLTATDIRSPEVIESIRKALETETDGATNFGIRKHRKKDGTTFKVELMVHHIVNNGKPALLALAHDVTERVLAEEKLKESEFQFRKVTENEILGVSWASPDGSLINANSTFCRIVGYSVHEIAGMHFSEFTHPEDARRELQLINKILQGETDYYQIEKRYITRNGDCTWVELNLSTYRNDSGAVEFFIGIVKDINERKKAEEEIRKSHEELRQLSSYLETIREEERTNIAREIHDELGQQLTALKMDASWLNKKVSPESKAMQEKITGMISLIDETVRTVRRISTELRPGILDDLGLVDALLWQSQEFEKRTGIACHFRTSVTEPALEKKLSTGIFRVYQETLTNVARHANASEISTTFEQLDENAILEVRDNGKGFDQKEIRQKKTLGLVGMKERAKMFGGQLTVKSTAGKGTVITLQVPLHFAHETEHSK